MQVLQLWFINPIKKFIRRCFVCYTNSWSICYRNEAETHLDLQIFVCETTQSPSPILGMCGRHVIGIERRY